MTHALRYRLGFIFLWSVYAAQASGGAEPGLAAPAKDLPLPGQVLSIDAHPAFIIPAKSQIAGKAMPWVWYAPTLRGLPGQEERWMFERFQNAGIAIAGIDVGESYGSPPGRKLFSLFYSEMTGARGFSRKPVLLGRSRGGLMTLSWAADHPDQVAAFAGIYPVCNIASYPGVANAAGAYETNPAELLACLETHNPIDRLAPLAKAGVPLFAIHGDSDTVVPLDANSGLVKKRYDALGGKMQLIVPAGQGHNMWTGFFQCQELVDFVTSHATRLAFESEAKLKVTQPLDYQVVQRTTATQGKVGIAGEVGGAEAAPTSIEARLRSGSAGQWTKLPVTFSDGRFSGQMEVPAGGWYQLDVRVLAREELLAEASVEHVGVGEVFVVAGQSNSANHGEERQNTKTGRVATFDGARWQVANDPQPGASGGGGSFLPLFGDAIVEQFNVPVGFLACGIGATSVREWLPRGATFPNPPTIESRVSKTEKGDWQSKGEAFEACTSRMKQLGPHGFRAVLWHQGESDANQADPSRTLPGQLYSEYLRKLIVESRRVIGWDVPWFVAQVSYHVPGDESSPEIRSAQASLWKDIALEGPDSDAIKGEYREAGGKGVHFSGPGLRVHATRWAEKVVPWLEQQVKR